MLKSVSILPEATLLLVSVGCSVAGPRAGSGAIGATNVYPGGWSPVEVLSVEICAGMMLLRLLNQWKLRMNAREII